MRLIGTAVAVAAALTLLTAGVADAKRHRAAPAFKFCIQCPAPAPITFTRGTCSAKGKTREDARATCQTQNLLCYVRNYSKKTCK